MKRLVHFETSSKIPTKRLNTVTVILLWVRNRCGTQTVSFFIRILLIPEKQDRLISALKVFHGLDLHLTPNSEVMNENTAMATAIFWKTFKTNKFTSAAQDGSGLTNVLMTQHGPCLLRFMRNMDLYSFNLDVCKRNHVLIFIWTIFLSAFALGVQNIIFHPWKKQRNKVFVCTVVLNRWLVLIKENY